MTVKQSLTISEIENIIMARASGKTYLDIKQHYGVNNDTISHILKEGFLIHYCANLIKTQKIMRPKHNIAYLMIAFGLGLLVAYFIK